MNDDIHALSGAYAVDAVDDLERARFEAHLAVCADCRTEVASLRATADELSYLTFEAPPAGLRSRVLDDITRVRPLPPLVKEVAPAAAPARRRLRAGWLALAATVVLLGGTAAVTQPWSSPSHSQQTVAAQVLAAPDATRVTQTFPDGASAVVVRSETVGRAVITTTDMPAPPSGKAYQLWLQTPAGSMVPAGMMPPGPDQTVVLSGDATTATAVGITVEPAGGSKQPTTPPIALFDLATG